MVLWRSARMNWKNESRLADGFGAGKTGEDTGLSKVVIESI
jgi:hypothetical protein